MRTLWMTALALACVFLLNTRTAAAETHDEFDQRITSELGAMSPAAVSVFREANEARDRGDLALARDRYEEVIRLAPAFHHAERRLCGVEVQLGRRESGIAHCRKAIEAGNSPENLSSLARALATHPYSAADFDEAVRLEDRALSVAPDDISVRDLDCGLALEKSDEPRLRGCVNVLRRIAPNDSRTDVYAALLAGNEGRFDEAHEALDRAREHGLKKEVYEGLSSALDAAVPWPLRAFSIGWRVAVGWLGGFPLLLLAGFVLSRLALGAATRLPTSGDGRPLGSEKTLRRVYRGVLWLCCAYYYLSLPLVLLLVVGAGGGIVLGFVMLGTIPIKLIVIIGVVVFSTVGAVLKSLFVKARNEEPGLRLDVDEHPELQSALAEVAGKIGTRPVDVVYLTPGTEVAVMERGGMRGLLGGSAERCLILGAGVLKGMKVLELKSILAHEHGHLHNEDTAGGGFALAVRRSLFTMAITLARAGAAAWYNPAWWFLRGFDRVFLVISQGASRLQEVLADRWAVHAYGSEAFESGLRHVISRSARFDAHVNATLAEVVKDKLPLLNLYRYKPTGEVKDVDEKIEEAIDAKPTAYDSHPSPRDRIALCRALDRPAPEDGEDASKPAWSLFSDRKALEEQMTDEVRARVLTAHQVAIPKPRKPASESTETEATGTEA